MEGRDPKGTVGVTVTFRVGEGLGVGFGGVWEVAVGGTGVGPAIIELKVVASGLRARFTGFSPGKLDGTGVPNKAGARMADSGPDGNPKKKLTGPVTTPCTLVIAAATTSPLSKRVKIK